MGVFFYHSLPYFFEKRSLIVPGAMHLARLVLTGLHVTGILLLLASQCWDYRHILHAQLFSVDAGHSNSSSQSSMVSTLLTVPFPQPFTNYF